MQISLRFWETQGLGETTLSACFYAKLRLLAARFHAKLH